MLLFSPKIPLHPRNTHKNIVAPPITVSTCHLHSQVKFLAGAFCLRAQFTVSDSNTIPRCHTPFSLFKYICCLY